MTNPIEIFGNKPVLTSQEAGVENKPKKSPSKFDEALDSKVASLKGEKKEVTKNLLSGKLNIQTELLDTSISAGQLFESEARTGNTMKSFLKIENSNAFIVDFKGNNSAEYNVGLSDIVPEEVKKIRIIGERNGRKYDMTGERRGIGGGFYTDTGRYIPVYSGFKIEVLEKHSIESLETIKKENSEKINTTLKSPLIEKFRNKYSEKELESIVKKSVLYGIDPAFVLALRSTENGGNGIQFGIMKAGIDTFDGQLTLACRTIQNNMSRYTRITSKSPMDGENFSGEFVGFLSSIYAPIGASNDPKNLNSNHLKNLLTFYGNYSGKSYDIEKTLASNISFMRSWETKINSSEIIGKTKPEDFIESAKKHLGKPYILGAGRGNFTNATDCSGLVLLTGKDTGVLDYGYNDTAQGISRITTPKNTKDIVAGDLVFIHDSTGHITHVEIALGPVEGNKVPIIDASKSVGGVTTRYQTISSKISAGTPIFYG